MKRLSTKLNTAIIYTRVSSQDQLQGYSLETQEKICRDYADKSKLVPIKVFREEGESAKTADRTQLQEMMKYVALNKNKIGYLIIYKIDRLSRNTNDFFFLKSYFNSHGIRVISASEPTNESSSGELMETMLAGFAQFDNRMRTERTVGGMQEALNSGYWTFKAPFGYKNSKHDRKKGHSVVTIEPEQAEVVRFIFHEYSKNIYTYRELSKKANKFSDGKYRISPQYLKKILNNPFYYGQLETESWGISSKGNHEPIISKELYDKVQYLQTGGTSDKQVRNRNHPDFPLRGLLCGCGTSFTGGWTRGKLGKRYAYYSCGKKNCELRRSIAKTIFETEFSEYLESLTPTEKNLRVLEDAIKEVYKQELGLVTTNKKNVETQIKSLKERKEGLLELKLRDSTLVSDEDFKSQNKKIDSQIQTLESSLLEKDINQFNLDEALDFSFTLIKNLPKVWQALDVVDFKALRAVLFPENLIYTYPSFQTPTLSFIYSMNLTLGKEKETLVALRGIEPRFAG